MPRRRTQGRGGAGPDPQGPGPLVPQGYSIPTRFVDQFQRDDVEKRPPAHHPLMTNPPLGVLAVQFSSLLEGEVRFDRLTRALYSTDASVYQIVPLGVVLPKSEADVVAAVKACAEHRVPLTARGGGTSQAGQ